VSTADDFFAGWLSRLLKGYARVCIKSTERHAATAKVEERSKGGSEQRKQWAAGVQGKEAKSKKQRDGAEALYSGRRWWFAVCYLCQGALDGSRGGRRRRPSRVATMRLDVGGAGQAGDGFPKSRAFGAGAPPIFSNRRPSICNHGRSTRCASRARYGRAHLPPPPASPDLQRVVRPWHSAASPLQLCLRGAGTGGAQPRGVSKLLGHVLPRWNSLQ